VVNELVEAADDKQLTKLINRYARVDLILVDKLGYPQTGPARRRAVVRSSHRTRRALGHRDRVQRTVL
jgi:DNA replication protein DnaC